MTLQELAALPIGTRVRFLMEINPIEPGGFAATYDFGEITQAGNTVHILWDVNEEDMSGVTIIDTKGSPWFAFVRDMEVE